MIPVKDKPDWARNGPAVVNVDTNAYEEHMKKFQHAQKEKAEIDNIKLSINNLNNQMSAMTDTLVQVLTILKK